MKIRTAATALLLASVALVILGEAIGSTGFAPPWGTEEPTAATQILWEIRLPRSLGAWLAGALLGLSGAIAQGLFRNPLADPYLLGSSAGGTLGVALLLVVVGVSPAAGNWAARLGLSGAAFVGAVFGVALTLSLARGVQHTVRLLLAGVIVGFVLGAVVSLVMLAAPEIMRTMQAFMLGTTGFLGWPSVGLLAAALLVSTLTAVAFARALDALTLGEAAAISLGIPLAQVRVILVAALALATGTAVAQTGMIAFVGLIAPHLVRHLCRPTHAGLLCLSAIAGGVLLLAADVAGRGVIAPQELPVGVLTAVLGGGYLLWLMHRQPVRGQA
jgi:iron complex transport system permease protein